MENPKSIDIFVKFDPVLGSIIGQTEMKIVMSESAPFVFLLHSIFTSYPEIQRHYPPGKLAMRLNNRQPTEYDLLHRRSCGFSDSYGRITIYQQT